ncbi:MAG: DUF2851 family protein [Ignavibacteriales bacterium]|nr:DUF2851 family protein [Ignavibacteriales bacterium]
MNDKNSKIHESTLYEIWKKQSYQHPLKTSTGEEITILDVGVHNQETGGPDFKNARIRIGNLTYIGDIEIDSNYSDWKTHGHNIDSKYTKVILHASLLNTNNYGYVYTREGRKVPSICFSDFIEIEHLEEIKKEVEVHNENSGSSIKCAVNIDQVNQDIIEKVLQQLGIIRFEKKCNKVFNRLKELQFIKELNIKEPVISYELSSQFHERKFNHSDFRSKEIWQQLFYELIFEALGYSKNKSQMINLAQAVNVNYLSKIENDGVLVEKYEAAFLFISGLALGSNSVTEEVSKKYLEKISYHWNSIRPFYDGKYFDETHWHFFRMRPQNFPTIRIAGGARLVRELLHKNMISVITRKIDEIYNLSVLVNSLRSFFIVKSDGFWKNHYVLDQKANGEIKYFIGVARADEIVVNVVLPFFSVYFDVFGNQQLAKKIVKVYSLYEQRSENQIVTDMAQSLNMNDHVQSTIYTQGMIELFRNYCSRNRCLECEIGKIIFN